MKGAITRELASETGFQQEAESPVDYHEIIEGAQQRAVELGVSPHGCPNSIEFTDPESTAKALVCFSKGMSYSKTEKESGLSRHTLIRLKFDHAANIEKMKPHFARQFAILADVGSDLLMKKFDRMYENPEQLDDISPDRLAVTIGVMTDKAAQLAGMASVTIEHRKGASIEDALEFQRTVRERLKAAETVIDAEPC